MYTYIHTYISFFSDRLKLWMKKRGWWRNYYLEVSLILTRIFVGRNDYLFIESSLKVHNKFLLGKTISFSISSRLNFHRWEPTSTYLVSPCLITFLTLFRIPFEIPRYEKWALINGTLCLLELIGTMRTRNYWKGNCERLKRYWICLPSSVMILFSYFYYRKYNDNFVVLTCRSML